MSEDSGFTIETYQKIKNCHRTGFYFFQLYYEGAMIKYFQALKSTLNVGRVFYVRGCFDSTDS